MNPNDTTPLSTMHAADHSVIELSVAQLVAEVYESAPPVEKGRLLEQLLRPLGVLALVAVVNGIFARIRFRGGWPQLQVQLDDVQKVHAADVIALVDYVQQVCIDAVDGLAQLLSASPALASSGAAALLISLLVRRARARREGDYHPSSAGVMA